MRITLDEVCNLSQIAREISQIARIFTFQWIRFSFGGNFELKIFFLVFVLQKKILL